MAGDLDSDSLFIGLTRPPMIFGVSYTFAMFNMLIGLVGYILAGDFKFLAAIVPIHFVGYLICSKEPLFIELFKTRAEKCNRSRNRFFHGANSYDQY
jgi:type IV secretion system protein VirB3